jgi:hypothetical protein
VYQNAGFLPTVIFLNPTPESPILRQNSLDSIQGTIFSTSHSFLTDGNSLAGVVAALTEYTLDLTARRSAENKRASIYFTRDGEEMNATSVKTSSEVLGDGTKDNPLYLPSFLTKRWRRVGWN